MADDETPTTDVIIPPSAEVSEEYTEDDLSEYEHMCALLADIYERMERIEAHLDTASREHPEPAAENQIEESRQEVEEEKTTIQETEQEIAKAQKRVTFLW